MDGKNLQDSRSTGNLTSLFCTLLINQSETDRWFYRQTKANTWGCKAEWSLGKRKYANNIYAIMSTYGFTSQLLCGVAFSLTLACSVSSFLCLCTSLICLSRALKTSSEKKEMVRLLIYRWVVLQPQKTKKLHLNNTSYVMMKGGGVDSHFSSEGRKLSLSYDLLGRQW